jgi:hypothetical protein
MTEAGRFVRFPNVIDSDVRFSYLRKPFRGIPYYQPLRLII